MNNSDLKNFDVFDLKMFITSIEQVKKQFFDRFKSDFDAIKNFQN